MESGAAQSRSLGGVDWVLPRNAGILAHNSLQLAVRCSDQVFFQNFCSLSLPKQNRQMSEKHHELKRLLSHESWPR